MSRHEHYDVEAMQRQWRIGRGKLYEQALAQAETDAARQMVETSRALDEAELAVHVWLLNAGNAGRPEEEVGLALAGMLAGIAATFASNFAETVGDAEINAKVLLSIVTDNAMAMLRGEPIAGAVTSVSSAQPMPGGRA